MKHSKTLFFIIFFGLNLSTEAWSLDIWKKYAKLKSLEANFTQEKEMKELGVTLKSNGSMKFKKPDFFEWKVASPRAFSFIFKKDAIEFVENGKVIKNLDTTKFDAKMLTAVKHLKAWLTIDRKFIEANYKVTEVKKGLYNFTPIGSMKMFKRIQIETKDDLIKKIQLDELSDDLIRIDFSHTKINYEN